MENKKETLTAAEEQKRQQQFIEKARVYVREKSEELLQKVKEKGVNIAYVTLHVGLGTFRPVKVDDVNEHVMHSEFYHLEEEDAKIINDTKKNGGKIISVGTTSTRTLETIGDEN